MSETYEPIKLIVDEVVLNGQSVDYALNNAVSKQYVDDKISALVNNAGPALDTLKELGDALSAAEGSIATSIVNQIAAETTRADTEEKRIDGRLITAEATIASHVTTIASHASDLSSHGSSIAGLQDDLAFKFDKAGGNISGEVVLDSYLNFGPNWRVKASADGSKIVFEFKRPDNIWRPALPFICKA